MSISTLTIETPEQCLECRLIKEMPNRIGVYCTAMLDSEDNEVSCITSMIHPDCPLKIQPEGK